MAALADLIASPALRNAIFTGLLERARAGALDPADNTLSRRRWARRLLERPDVLATIVTRITAAVALNATIRADWEATGTFQSSDVTFECEQQLVALADEDRSDFVAISYAMTDEATIRTLTGACAAAANAIIADPDATVAELAYVRARADSVEKLREAATKSTPLLVTHSSLRGYGGDLTDVPIADLIATIRLTLQGWLRALAAAK